MSIRMGDKILAANYKPNNATQDVAGSVVTPYQLKETVNDKANVNLDNLSETGETRFNGKANIDLNNLSEVGETHFDNKYLGTYNITNCVIEEPQRIKLDLTDGNLTLKKGSELFIPNGFEEYGVTPHSIHILCLMTEQAQPRVLNYFIAITQH